MSKYDSWSLELPVSEYRRRLWEILPGLMSWATLIVLSLLAFIVPFWIAIFIIAYDLYVFIRAFYMSIHLVYAYRRLRIESHVDWLQRCRTGQGRRYHNWERIHHVVLLPTYDESITVLRSSLNSLRDSDYPKDHFHVVVGFEERAGQSARDRAQKLQTEYNNEFATFLTSFHPDNLAKEARVKSANATWAIQRLEEKLLAKGIDFRNVLVSNFDSDTIASSSYFSNLTYVFCTTPDRYHASYQPLPMYNNNIWDAPAFSRVIATGSTFWQMIESTRPERLVTFSSHSMTLKALKDVGYWQTDIISEDSRIFWQCLLHYHGHYRTVPLYTTVSMDAALAPSWFKTLKNQYKQKRRWAWGIENFPFLAEGFLRDRKIVWSTKLTYLFRTLEGHHSWATAPIIVAGLGWLPIYFGGPEFHSTLLSYSLPRMARSIMTVAMSGLIISSFISIMLLPPRPNSHSRYRYIAMIAQWVLVPIIATVLSAIPALDAETRLMFGRDLQFNVMEKHRRTSSS